MSPKLRSVTVRSFIRALEKDGFVLRKRSGKGSHRVYIHPDSGVRVRVPYHHSGEPLRPGTLHRLIEAVGWTDEDLIRLRLMRRG